LAVPTASVRVGCFFGCAALVAFRAVGIIGVGIIEPRSMGCILIGPVDVDLVLGIIDNAFVPNLFDRFSGSTIHTFTSSGTFTVT
jgi:hypothetical protein